MLLQIYEQHPGQQLMLDVNSYLLPVSPAEFVYTGVSWKSRAAKPVLSYTEN